MFQTLYRMIDGLNDNRLRDYVIKLDSMFTQQNELFYFYCGKYLERLVKRLITISLMPTLEVIQIMKHFVES